MKIKMKRVDLSLLVVTLALLASIAGLFISDTSEQSGLIIPVALQIIGTLGSHQDKDDKDDKK
jgi:hypothetical protein